MRIAYGKLGRSIPLTIADASNVGGDIEVIRLLHLLLDRGHEVHLIGRNRGITNEHGDKLGYDLSRKGKLIDHWVSGGVFSDPPEMSRERDATFESYDQFFRTQAHLLPHMDAWIVWLGQHGSCLHPVPVVQPGRTGYTNPMMSDVNYGYPLIAMMNELEVVPRWLCPDPRNMIKFRDIWNPKQNEILAQFNTEKPNTFFDERDQKLRHGGTRYKYAGIEMLAVSPMHPTPFGGLLATPPNRSFGLLVNEGYSNLGAKNRLVKIKSWLGNNLAGTEIFGHWCEKSQEALGKTIIPVAFADVTNTLMSWRATMTFPATGTGWATAKPWECFNAGCICFKHPEYDSQGHIYSKRLMQEALDEAQGAELYNFLCPSSPMGLWTRVAELQNDGAWRRKADMQYRYLIASHKRLDGGAGHLLQSIGAV